MDLHPFKILSLCSGVGGLDLGVKLAKPNARTVCYVEIEAFACEVLANRMEEERLDQAPIWTNLKTFDGKPWRGKVDCIIGGYPCQPFSVAGKMLGQNDERHLWPEIKRIISEVRPPFCFFENVSNHLRIGFEEVANDLSAMGYKIKAGLFSAKEVGAPHQRERLFILAYSDCLRSLMQPNRNTSALERKSAGEEDEENQSSQTAKNCCSGKQLANNNGNRCFNTKSSIATTDDQKRRQEFFKESFSCRNNIAADGFSEEQRGFAKQNSGFAISNKETILANSEDFLCQWCECQRSGSGKSKTEIGSDDKYMANSKSARARKYESKLWQGSEEHCHKLVNPNCIGFRSWIHGKNGEKNNDEASRSITTDDKTIPSWPPSPSDHEGWNAVPNYLKPAIHRMADGMANRVDEIRACGNGVVPLATAYAWRTLVHGTVLEENKLTKN